MGHGRLVRYYIYCRSEGKLFYEHHYLRWPARKECPGETTPTNKVIVPASSREDRLMLCCLISRYIRVNSICNLHSLFLHGHRIHPRLLTSSKLISQSAYPKTSHFHFFCLAIYLSFCLSFLLLLFSLCHYYLLLTVTLDVTAGLSLMTLNCNL